MNMNIECVRKIICYCVRNIDYEEIGLNEWKEKCISLNMLYDTKDLKGFPKKDIMYSVMRLNEMGYIKLQNISPLNKTYINNCIISDVTYLGHNFYNSIQDDTVWNKTKSIIAKAGNHTLKFVEDTAQMIAVASAKQAITVTMTQK